MWFLLEWLMDAGRSHFDGLRACFSRDVLYVQNLIPS